MCRGRPDPPAVEPRHAPGLAGLILGSNPLTTIECLPMLEIEQAVLRALFVPLDDAEKSLTLPPGVADDLVLALARHHRLSPALSTLEAPEISPALLDAFHRDRLVTLGRATLHRRALIEVLRALDAARLKTVVLKGIAYEELVYPTPGTRPATDIDLLVHRDARPAAFDAFQTLGFEPTSGGPGFDEPDYHEVSLRRGDINVDLHFGLVPFVRCPIDYNALWAATAPLPIEGATAYTLSRAHAALHQALHMAVHHFDVPAIYLLDLARLTSEPDVAAEAAETARIWRCLRPWETSVSLTAAFIPQARVRFPRTRSMSAPRIERVVGSFGGLAALPRFEQLRRKLDHFDSHADAVRYLISQGRRVLREKFLTLNGAPSPVTRLGWTRGTDADK
jgi:Uncharacterised nucleotidyltransferase